MTKKYSVIAVSAITEYEIYVGSSQEQDKFWDDFFQYVIVLPYDSSTNNVAIDIFRTLKKSNRLIEIPDLLIGASALYNDLKLATLNQKHFRRIAGLSLIDLDNI